MCDCGYECVYACVYVLQRGVLWVHVDRTAVSVHRWTRAGGGRGGPR